MGNGHAQYKQDKGHQCRPSRGSSLGKGAYRGLRFLWTAFRLVRGLKDRVLLSPVKVVATVTTIVAARPSAAAVNR